MLKIEHATIETVDLTRRERTEMFLLMQKYYLGVSLEKFEQDLSEKSHVMILRDRACRGCIVGFSTLMGLDINICGHTVKAVFSGDTVVEKRYRCSLGFAYEITRYLFGLAQSCSPQLFYVLICKGWRTYRILPFLFRQFSPRFDQPTNVSHQKVMDAFGAQRYPDEYCAEKGLVIFNGEAQRIRPDSAEAIDPLRTDQHINFFAEKNPHHLRGDELVCVAPVASWNFTDAFHKLLEPRSNFR
jgi:hypothetical protein